MSVAGTRSIEVHDAKQPPHLFARLEPRNAKAYRAFTEVIDAIARDPERYKHHAQFITHDPCPVPLQSLLERHTPGSTSDASTNYAEIQEAISTASDQEVFRGGYMFSLKIKPELTRLGWRVGNGRWSQDPELGQVDFLLSINISNIGVHGLHARFLFDVESGIFGVRACHHKKGVTLDHNRFGSDQGLWALGPKAMIQMGDLLYEYSYAIAPGSDMDRMFGDLKKKFFIEVLEVAPPIEATSLTPSENDMIFGPWRMHRPVGKGAFGIVSAASRRQGPLEVVAVKHMRSTSKQSAANIEREVQSAQALTFALREHEYKQYVLQLKDVIYPRGRESFVNGSISDVLLLYTPLTRGTFFSHLLSDRVKVDSKHVGEALLAQILKGLACLHSFGWVHRDIKPANLGVISLAPPRAVILDLGHAFYCGPQSPDPDDSSQENAPIPPSPDQYGTPAYIAPEMERKNYGPAVDIWAAGLVAYELFVGPHPFKSRGVNPWRQDKNSPEQLQHNLKVLKDIHNALLAEPAGCLEHLISDMVRSSSQSRPSAAKALKHPSMVDAAKSSTKRLRE